MQKIGVGIIGSGFMGLTYSEVVARHATDCRLVAITGGKRANQLAADYEVAAEVSVEALLAGRHPCRRAGNTGSGSSKSHKNGGSRR